MNITETVFLKQFTDPKGNRTTTTHYSEDTVRKFAVLYSVNGTDYWQHTGSTNNPAEWWATANTEFFENKSVVFVPVIDFVNA